MSENEHDKIDEEDKLLFRQAMKKIQPLSKPQGRVRLQKKKHRLEKNVQTLEIEGSEFFLSDHSNEEIVAQEQLLFAARSGLSAKQIKKLKKGKLTIQARLDLHGLDLESARSALSSFLSFAYHNHKRNLLIIHGKGHTDKPILKNKVNQWLRQLDIVLAFSSAVPRDGGAGATYVLLKK